MIFRTTILRLVDKPDRQGDIINGKTKIDIAKHVSVVVDFKGDVENHIGVATLKQNKKSITAKIELFDTKKAKAIIGAIKGRIVYPAVGGFVKKRNEDDRNILDHITIKVVSLSTSRNCDLKIKPIEIKAKRKDGRPAPLPRASGGRSVRRKKS